MRRYGYDPEHQTLDAMRAQPRSAGRSAGRDPDLLPGRVTELRREQYTVVTERGECSAVLKGSFAYGADPREGYPSVGDYVWVRINSSGVSRIVELMPRRSKFSRADFSGHAAGYVKTIREQVVATNFDYVFILSSLNRDLNVNRILRYLTQANQSGGQPVVLLTKADLQTSGESPSSVVDALRQHAPEVPVHAVSSLTGAGLEALDAYLQPGKTLVFLGMSGVGKSSLLNALMQQQVMDVKAIREDDSRGRHTTTHRQLFLLPCGAMVIDTPGMRELGLFDAEAGIQASFADVEVLIGQCRFHDCRHSSEPGCAVLSALAEGTLPAARWAQYQAQTGENRFVDDRAGYLKEKRAWQKSIAMKTRVKNPKK